MSLLTTNFLGGFCFIKNTGGIHMKHLLFSSAVAISMTVVAGTAYAGCISLATCRATAGNNCNCCPTGTSEKQYKCPDGWEPSGSICYRSATRSFDSIGYTETTYGSCAGTANGTIMCYDRKCGTPMPSCSLM